MDIKYSDPNIWDNSIDCDDALDGSDGGYTKHGSFIVAPAMRELVRLRAELDACAAALPGAYYMDQPDGGDVSVSEQLKRMAKDAERYRLLRRKFAIISDGEGRAEFCAINLPRPTYIAPSSAIELDTALDRERLGLDGARPPTPTGWSDTDWIKHLQEQKEPHPLAGLHINQGSMDAAADAYEAEYNAARMLEALKAAAQFVETEQFPIGWSVDRIREVIAKVSGTTPNSACTDTPPDAALREGGGVMDVVDKLLAACVGYPVTNIPWPHHVLHDAAEEITRLRAELAEYRQDAERYRAIRYAIAHNIDPDYQGVMNDGISVSERMEDLDKVADGLKVKVDAAIAAKEE